jgi:pSer/pThr/pTyr-binding forkhead associated (FHA) protein
VRGAVAAYTLIARDAQGQTLGSVPLGPDPVSVGRGNDCGITLPSTAVSRRHASFVRRPDGQVLVQDEGSANGVYVDGELIRGPTPVSEHSRIQISEFALALEPVSATDQVRAPRARRPAEASAEAEELILREDRITFDTILEPHAGAALALAASQLELHGRGGPYDGTVIKLDRPLCTVGRTSETEITLADPSISRRHAQLRLSVGAQGFTVVDLRSSNGTFVDGERVKRAEVKPGQVVRFGDLAFRVTLAQRGERSQRRLSPGKRVAIALSVLTVLIGGVAVVAWVRRPKPPPPVVVTPEQRLREIQAEAQRQVDEGRRRIDLKEWTAAIAALDRARAKDPLNAEVPRLRRLALDELEHERTYRSGLEHFNLGNRASLIKAKEIFGKVPSSSVYHREVRYKVKIVDERLADDFRVEGVSRCQKKYWLECQAALCRFFELVPEEVQVVGEARLAELLEDAEKRLARKPGWSECKAKRYLERGHRLATKDDPVTLLEQKYEVAELRDVLLIYIEGKIDPSLKKLGQVIALPRMRPNLAQLREVNRQLLIIKGKYQEGFSAFRERKVDEAQRDWDLLLAADAAIVPSGIESSFRREVTRMLGDLYFELGDEQLKAGRYRAAYGLFGKGKLANPKHQKLLGGMLDLEKAAERLIREAKELRAGGSTSDARAKLGLARDISEKDRPTWKEAEKILGQLQ